MTDREAYDALPALRAALDRYKVEVVAERAFTLALATGKGSAVLAYCERRLADAQAMAPHQFRRWYLSECVAAIHRAGLASVRSRAGNTVSWWIARSP